MNLAAGQALRLETHSNFDALDRLHGHHGLGEFTIEFSIPLGMGAQSKRQAFHDDFDDPAKRVARFLGFVDQLFGLPRPWEGSSE